MCVCVRVLHTDNGRTVERASMSDTNRPDQGSGPSGSIAAELGLGLGLGSSSGGSGGGVVCVARKSKRRPRTTSEVSAGSASASDHPLTTDDPLPTTVALASAVTPDTMSLPPWTCLRVSFLDLHAAAGDASALAAAGTAGDDLSSLRDPKTPDTDLLEFKLYDVEDDLVRTVGDLVSSLRSKKCLAESLWTEAVDKAKARVQEGDAAPAAMFLMNDDVSNAIKFAQQMRLERLVAQEVAPLQSRAARDEHRAASIDKLLRAAITWVVLVLRLCCRPSPVLHSLYHALVFLILILILFLILILRIFSAFCGCLYFAFYSVSSHGLAPPDLPTVPPLESLPLPLPHEEDVAPLSVAELREVLEHMQVSTAGAVEKAELRELARQALAAKRLKSVAGPHQVAADASAVPMPTDNVGGDGRGLTQLEMLSKRVYRIAHAECMRVGLYIKQLVDTLGIEAEHVHMGQLDRHQRHAALRCAIAARRVALLLRFLEHEAGSTDAWADVKVFKSTFGDEVEDEALLLATSARAGAKPGKLFLTPRHVAFRANIMGFVTKRLIPLHRVQSITKTDTFVSDSVVLRFAEPVPVVKAKSGPKDDDPSSTDVDLLFSDAAYVVCCWLFLLFVVCCLLLSVLVDGGGGGGGGGDGGGRRGGDVAFICSWWSWNV